MAGSRSNEDQQVPVDSFDAESPILSTILPHLLRGIVYSREVFDQKSTTSEVPQEHSILAVILPGVVQAIEVPLPSLVEKLRIPWMRFKAEETEAERTGRQL